METYQIMQIGFYVCLALAVLFFIISLLLFFLFDVRAIIAAKSGKKKAKSIKELEAENSATGRLMRKKPAARTTGNLEKKKPVIKKGVVQTPAELDGSSATAKIRKKGKTAEIGRTAELGKQPAQPVPDTSGAEETSVLGAERAETSVLYDSPTVRLDSAETTILVQSASIPEVEGVRFEIVKKIVCVSTQERA
ncbi:MAG: hypothetical protein IJH07_00660 [Ruminococcus sp.]|nr:hypothetical protein [Ruminococcus sp.]